MKMKKSENPLKAKSFARERGLGIERGFMGFI